MIHPTHLVDDLSLSVPSLKQQVLIKVAETLIRPDLEMHCNVSSLVYGDPLKRLSDNIKQLPSLSKSFKDDIRDFVSCLYRISQNFPPAKSLPPSAFQFNAFGDLDVHRTFDGYVDDILRGPRPPRTYLFQFLRDSCHCHQDRSIHLTLCELLKWHRYNVEPSLRHARREVNVLRDEDGDWHYDIRFVIEDVDDPAQWVSFANMLNINLITTEFSFEGNAFSVTTRVETPFEKTLLLLWSKMTTLQKMEHAEEIFKAALEQSNACFLIQTMRYMNSPRRMNLIKRNLVSFIFSFLVHPFYIPLLPDLQLVEEDLQLAQEEDELDVFDNLLNSLDFTGNNEIISVCLLYLWHYVYTRNYSVGDHVFHNIRTFLHDEEYGWYFEDDNNEEFKMLREMFPAKR